MDGYTDFTQIVVSSVDSNRKFPKLNVNCDIFQEDLSSVEVDIDHRVHSRIIGSRGRAVHKIMEEFHVDIRFPGRESDNPNLVVITGAEDAVMDCRDHLLNLEEEYVSWSFTVWCQIYVNNRNTNSSSRRIDKHLAMVVFRVISFPKIV
jgi:hypothetical protein